MQHADAKTHRYNPHQNSVKGEKALVWLFFSRNNNFDSYREVVSFNPIIFR